MITITRQNGRIVVEDVEIQARYSVPEGEEARNQFGHEAEMTWGEAYEAGILKVVEDENDSAFATMYANTL